jgi:hypothetical protein
MMKKAVVFVWMGLSALGFNAFAHGTKPQYGGVVSTAGELSFELVAHGEAATLYVVDHGKPVDTSKMSGKLSVLNGAEKSEAELKVVGPNKLEAAAKLSSGSKAVATVTLPNGKVVTARFSVK